MEKITKTEAEWRELLGPDAYRVLREKGTERAFVGEYTDNKATGVYECRACGNPLFDSLAKYDSGSGWPSFWEVAAPVAVEEHRDTTHGMVRTEVTCAKCGGHLGHVFPDGPRPTGLRYCINSVSMRFKPGE